MMRGITVKAFIKKLQRVKNKNSVLLFYDRHMGYLDFHHVLDKTHKLDADGSIGVALVTLVKDETDVKGICRFLEVSKGIRA